MGASTLKGHGFEFFEKGVICIQVYVSQLLGQKLTYACEYGLRENLAFENLQQFQYLEINCDFFGG